MNLLERSFIFIIKEYKQGEHRCLTMVLNSSGTKQLFAEQLKSVVFDVLLNQMGEKRLRSHALSKEISLLV